MKTSTNFRPRSSFLVLPLTGRPSAAGKMVTTRSSGRELKTNGEPTPEKPRLKKRASDTADRGDGAGKRPKLRETTDHGRWRMRDDEGRHTWHYLDDDEAAKEWPQTYADKYYLGLPLVSIVATARVPPQPVDHTSTRACPSCRSRRHPSTPSKTAWSSSRSSSSPRASGAANTEAPCFSYPA